MLKRAEYGEFIIQNPQVGFHKWWCLLLSLNYCLLLVIITNFCPLHTTLHSRRHRWESSPVTELANLIATWRMALLPLPMHDAQASIWTHYPWGSQNNFWRRWDDALECSQPWLREPWVALHCKQDSKVRSWHLSRLAGSPPRIEFCLTVCHFLSGLVKSHNIVS